MFSVFIKSLLVICAVGVGTASQLRKLQKNHFPHRLTNGEVRQLASLSNINYFNEVLDNILIPRVVGTKNHETVFNYIKTELEKLGWTADVDEFKNETPIFGRLTFKNIIGTLNPDAERYLVLACHYDSKYFKNQIFVGAIDSAVPCAMMLNLAKVLKNELNSIKDRSDLSLKLIFFDGEEAFENWGPKDSIYGAKHLAAKYHLSRVLARTTGETVSDLQKIDVLVLLDLIGHRDINFVNFFPDTSKWFSRMADTEDRLHNLRLFKPRSTRYFIRRDFFNSNIEDDHIPFLRKNVPILHLIPISFPREWHTPNDNRDIIDINAVENLNKIFRIFVAEYLHIKPPIVIFTMWVLGYIIFLVAGNWLAIGDIIDLSWEYNNETIFWPGQRPFGFTKQIATDLDTGFWYAINEFCTGEHVGTHFDAPYHFNKNGWKVSEVPAERLFAKGAIVNLRNEKDKNYLNAVLTVNDLQNWEKRNGPFENGSVLIVDFGRSKYWNTNNTKYFDFDLDNKMNFPGVSVEAAQWIANSKKFYGVGLDTPSIDPGNSSDFMAHRIFAENKLYHLENVKLLSELPEKGFDLIVAPMKIDGGTGAPDGSPPHYAIKARNHLNEIFEAGPVNWPASSSDFTPLTFFLWSFIIFIKY